jgi:cytochrome P450
MLTRATGTRRSLGRMGELVGFIRDPLAALENTRVRWGDVAVLPLPGPRLIQVTHPEHVTAVLKIPHRDRLATGSLRDLLGDGLITTVRGDVRARRQLVGRPLSKKAIDAYVSDMDTLAAAWVDALAAGRRVEMTRALFGLSLDILIRTLFGAQISLDKRAFAAHLEAYMYEFYLDNTGWRRLLPPRITTPGRRRRGQAVRGMQEIVRASVGRRRAAGPGNDLLYVLLTARDEEGRLLDEAELIDELLTMLIPGHETPALMLGYAVWLLAAHGAAQVRLREEVAALDTVTVESLNACRYLGAVVDESFRLYPPAYVIGREAREDMTIAGLAVKAGDQLVAPQWVVHRDQRWWQAPEQFRPERWLNGETDDLRPGTFFPFGGGLRGCLGGHFSRLMGQVVLAQLVRRVEVTADETYALSFIQGPTLRPREGIRVHVQPRRELSRPATERNGEALHVH